MTSPTSARPSSPAVRRRRQAALAARVLPAMAVAAVTALTARTGVLDTPAVVDLQLANPSIYAVTVQVSPGSDERWLSVATLGPGDARTVREVLDQGSTWRIRLTGQGVVAVELDVERRVLEAAGWQFVVPPELETALRDAQLPPSPPDS